MLRNILLLLGLFFVWRLVRNAFAPRRRTRRGAGDPRNYRNLTDQEISDADYEDLDRS